MKNKLKLNIKIVSAIWEDNFFLVWGIDLDLFLLFGLTCIVVPIYQLRYACIPQLIVRFNIDRL